MTITVNQTNCFKFHLFNIFVQDEDFTIFQMKICQCAKIQIMFMTAEPTYFSFMQDIKFSTVAYKSLLLQACTRNVLNFTMLKIATPHNISSAYAVAPFHKFVFYHFDSLFKLLAQISLKL